MKIKADYRSSLMLAWIRFLKFFNFPKKTSKVHVPKKVLLVSTTGIGDTLWSTPALSLLKSSFPICHLTVLTSALGAQILKNNPNIDKICVAKKASLSLIRLYFQLRHERFDTILICHISDRWLVPLCYFLGAGKLVGFERHAKTFAPLLSDSFEVGLKHPIVQRLSLIESLGAQGTDHQIKVFLTQKENEFAQQFIKEQHFKRNTLLVGLQPGASQPFKQWPLTHFIERSKKLSKRGNIQLIIFGNEQEAPLAQAIKKEVPVLIAAGKLTLRQSMALISKMDLFVTNDTGPMHLALAQKVPLVSIFSPTAHNLCWPHLQEPWFKRVVKPKTCETCIGHRCLKPYCMERITPDEVFSGVQELLSRDYMQK